MPIPLKGSPMTTTELNIVPVKTGLEAAVRRSLQIGASIKDSAEKRTVLAMLANSARFESARKVTSEPKKKQVRLPPSPAVRIGRMAEEAWDLFVPLERELGLPL
jgi:hypothetical protein